MDSAVIWKSYDGYTRTLSANCRKLGFAAGAIAWVFRSSTGTFPSAVEWAWVFIILYFFFDLLQYFVAALVLNVWMRTQEKQRLAAGQPVAGDYAKPGWIDRPAFGCFIIKVLFLLVGFVCLGVHIFGQAAHLPLVT